MSDTATPLSFTVTLTERAILRGVVQRLLSTMASWPTALVAVALTVLMLYPLAAPGLTLADAALIAAPFAGLLAIYALLLALIVWLAARRTARIPGLLAPVTYTLSDAGVSVRAEGGDSNLSWAHYRHARETRDFFLITLQSRQAHIIPRAQLSAEAKAALRTMLARHLPRGLRPRAD